MQMSIVAAGEAEEIIGQPLELCEFDMRSITIGKVRGRKDSAEIGISFGGLADKYQRLRRLDTGKSRWNHRDLCSDDRLYAIPLARLLKANDTVDPVYIRESKRGHPKLSRPS